MIFSLFLMARYGISLDGGMHSLSILQVTQRDQISEDCLIFYLSLNKLSCVVSV